MRRTLLPLSIAMVLIAATPAPFGGWVVISVQDLPEYLEVDESATLTFTLLQHGREPMSNRSPSVILGAEGTGWFSRADRVAARRARGAGSYEATITPRDTGELFVTIDADYNSARSMLLPIRVVAAGQEPDPRPLTERGRHLFVAKGCVTCHAKSDDRLMKGRTANPGLAPDLAGRVFDAEWLAAKLADPGQNRVRFNDYVEMPNLGLGNDEIAALVSYLRAPPGTAAAR